MRAIGIGALVLALAAGWLGGYAWGRRGGEVAPAASARPSDPVGPAVAPAAGPGPVVPEVAPAAEPDPVGPAVALAAGPGPEVALPALPPARPEPTEEQRAALRSRYLEDLEHEDAAVRSEAAEWTALDVETFPVLARLLAADPSPSVRRAAAQTLAGAMNTPEQGEAVDLLLAALRDPHPEVVLAALDSLELVGDAGLVPQLAFLGEHPDPEVRDGVADTIGWLRD